MCVNRKGNDAVKWMASIKFRRKVTVILAVILLFSGRLFGAIGKEDVLDGSSAWDMQNQLIELWGEPYELRPIRQDEGGIQLYETMTFTYGPAVPRTIPSLYAGGSLILSGAAVLFPHVTALWAISSVNSLAGTVLLPALWSRDPEINTCQAVATISRYTVEEGKEPVLTASKTTTYLCYNNLYDTSPIWMDMRSAETT